MSNRMFIDASHPEETRVVVVKGNRLEDFDFESEHKKQIRGNIYLAKVTRVEPSLQAAFVEYGGNRHGFLAFSEIHPDYYQIPLADRQALLAEEAKLAEQEDNDEAEAPEPRKPRRKRNNRKGRGQRQEASSESPTPEAEPVAMEAILAEWEANAPEEDDGDDTREAVAARTADDGNVISEDVDDDETDDSPDGNDQDDDDDRGSRRGRRRRERGGRNRRSARHSDEGNGDSDDSDDDGRDEGIDTVGSEDAMDEARPRQRVQRRQYKIQEVIKRRQIILVQVVKEERGNKGAALTTYLSLAGRYSVLMPNTARGGGISRKITNAPDRKRLKEIVRDLQVPEGMGVILRTAGANRTKAEIKRDYEYLMRMWDSVRDLTLASTAPTLVYEEGSLIKRSIRDLYNKDIGEILVSGEDGYREAKDFMRMLMPSHAKMVQPWRESQPIFARTGIEAQLDGLIQPSCRLKSGGYIIINQTEALVAIDVNSGKSTREHSIEDTALQTNLEAAEEVARQLRLRDLAGLIVIDFIDMEENRNNRAVEKKLKECLKSDRARIQVGRISHFGLLEMSRQRMRASVLESTMQPCPHCGGTGHVRSQQSVALHVIRSLEDYLMRNGQHHVTVRTSGDTALYILNHKRETLTDMEARFGLRISVLADPAIGTEMFAIDKGEVSDLPRTQPVRPDYGDEDDDPDLPIEDDEEETSAEAQPADEERDESDGDDERNRGRGKRRRKRRGRRDRDESQNGDAADQAAQESASDDEGEDDEGRERGKKRRRSRGRRGGRDRRKPRIPSAEPVGPLADSIAAEAEAEERESMAKAEAAKSAAEEQAREEERTVASVPEKEPEEAQRAPAPVQDNADAAPAWAETNGANSAEPIETGDVAGANDNDNDASTPPGEAEQRPARRRAAADSLNHEAEPVVTSEGDTAEKKSKKTGWWSRKGFF
ncbi:Rne/Rng family ribonuclease [Oricola cellulosilytica]|uniref:Ribonuclease E n=1 Tax=Oricola cellulosilytica TaxID=1429082 RepID=A0A4R0PB78_9HYPH|nr:ribonuclease E/G [Oricola cellulosilytica]TCD14510.1 ribonuclease E/G [Oricola cellulosilytica]